MFGENFSLEETGMLYTDVWDYKERQRWDVARAVKFAYKEVEEASKVHNEIVDRIFGKSE